jgi:hypothetical protein
MKNRKVFSTISTMGVLAGLSLQVQGQGITGYSQSSIASWGSGTIGYETGPAPTTGSGGTSQDNDSWGGNANGTAGFGALAQSFEVTSSGTLSTAQLVMAGAAATFNVELYDLGAYPASGYPTVPQQINGLNPAQVSSGGANLLASTSFNFASPSGQTLETLTFGGNVQLVTGELYLLSLDPTANADSTWWVRGGVPIAAYNTGMGYNADGTEGLQNFEGKSGSGSPNSGIRDFDLAITETAVPEPSTIALGVLGVSSFLFRRRSK